MKSDNDLEIEEAHNDLLEKIREIICEVMGNFYEEKIYSLDIEESRR